MLCAVLREARLQLMLVPLMPSNECTSTMLRLGRKAAAVEH